MSEKENRKCRVLVIASARPRLARVMGLLLPLNEGNDIGVAIEYLPCVARFDSYEDRDGNNVRYLSSVNYHGPDGTQNVGSSLAPFFYEEPVPTVKDANNEDKHNNKPGKSLGILGVALGAGIEGVDDVERIRIFFQTLRGGGAAQREPLRMEMIQPNPEYSSMKEENDAFKAMSAEAKEEAAIQQSIGPGKMAKFAHNFATGMIKDILAKEETALQVALAEERKREELLRKQQAELEALKQSAPPREFDPDKPRYACRKCRTILFGEDDLQDPPHVPAQHKFNSRKKHNNNAAHQSTCQSYFLSDNTTGLDWMGDMSEMEGRFNCPRCNFKLGTWHWAGAQCSCGTWVSPAIQIPKSKVDTLTPPTAAAPPGGGIGDRNAIAAGLPLGTIYVRPPFVSAAAQQQPQQQILS